MLESPGAQDLEESSTRPIVVAISKKKKPHVIHSDEIRKAFLENYIYRGESLKEAARNVGLSPSTGQSILRVFLSEGRID